MKGAVIKGLAVAIAIAAAWLGVLGREASAADFPTVAHGGRPYVEAVRLAEHLKARLEATPERAYIRTAKSVVTLTRDWARVEVDGKPTVLEAPVRLEQGVWLVPAGFVERVLSSLSPPTPTPAAAAPRGPVRPAASPAVKLQDVRFRSYPTFTRVVLEASSALAYTVESSGPREARIRLTGMAVEPSADEVGDGFISEVRVERAGADAVLRVLFEGPPGVLKPSTLTDPPRLLLDFAHPAEPARREAREAPAVLRTIVLDAGHGGHDSGAVGPAGLMEKDLVLDVTRRVAALVRASLPDVKVLLSRPGDHFVTLQDRTSFANKERADLFVSIHANAHRDVASEGVETYFLSSEATDNRARQVAALENGVVQLERVNGKASGREKVLKTILWDLAQSEFQLQSSRLAEVVQDSMTQSLGIPNRGVKQAGFYVLGGAAMPAILIEIGFVTNPREERKLKDGKYRDEIARAIFAGIAEYKRHLEQRDRRAAAR